MLTWLPLISQQPTDSGSRWRFERLGSARGEVLWAEERGYWVSELGEVLFKSWDGATLFRRQGAFSGVKKCFWVGGRVALLDSRGLWLLGPGSEESFVELPCLGLDAAPGPGGSVLVLLSCAKVLRVSKGALRAEFPAPPGSEKLWVGESGLIYVGNPDGVSVFNPMGRPKGRLDFGVESVTDLGSGKLLFVRDAKLYLALRGDTLELARDAARVFPGGVFLKKDGEAYKIWFWQRF